VAQSNRRVPSARTASVRLESKLGFIPKLNKQTVNDLRVFVPDLQTQKSMLEIEARIATEQNVILGLQNELGDFRRELWSNPRSAQNVGQRLAALSTRLSGSLRQHALAGLDQWFETLPFPLASILRAWQATPSQDFKTKQDHLLRFFEGTAEFLSIILLSAFSSNDALFEPHKQKLIESMQKQNLSFQRATFGTWKMVVEYLSKKRHGSFFQRMGSKARMPKITGRFAQNSFPILRWHSPRHLVEKSWLASFRRQTKCEMTGVVMVGSPDKKMPKSATSNFSAKSRGCARRSLTPGQRHS